MLERQQANLLQYRDRTLSKVNIDAVRLRSRRMTDRAIGREQAAAV